MSETESRREVLLEKMADHLLAEGLQGSSLRPLAAAAGTSDRMLLHYFENKAELLSSTLVVVTRRLATLLDSARQDRMSIAELLGYLAAMMKEPVVRPYLRLSLELTAAAARDEEPGRKAARAVYEEFERWIDSCLLVDEAEQRESSLALVLALVEGLVVLDALGFDAQIDDAIHRVSKTCEGPC